MRSLFFTIMICSFGNVSAQQTDNEVIIINNQALVLKTNHSTSENYSFQTESGKELIRSYQYYGKLNADNRGLVVFFVADGKYAFIEGTSKHQLIQLIVDDIRKFKVIDSAVVNTQSETAFIKRHPLPKGYIPLQELGNY